MSNSSELASNGNGVDFATLNHASADELKTTASKSGGARGVLGIAIVNNRNGNRMKFTQALHELLGSPTKLQFAIGGDYLYVGATIPHSTESVHFSEGTGKEIIYNKGFVAYLTKQFKLDFSECTSKSFHEVEIGTQEHEGQQITYAKIKMI